MMLPAQSRRRFLRTTALSGATLAIAGVLQASPVAAAPLRQVRLTDGPYGPLRTTPDPHGLLLPDGFSARVVAVTGQPVEGTDHVWHEWPDGGACFPTDDDGWIYVSNAEVFPFTGGVGAIRFDQRGDVVDAYSILEGTNMNCAGGPTPWGTWLSCEEFDLHDVPELAELAGTNGGRVWECDPYGPGQGEVRPAMGVFQHEAAAVDPVGRCVYMTEDLPDGLLYRFTPTDYPDLSEGVLEAALLDGDQLTWVEVPDPAALEQRPSDQLGDAATHFDGGEGMWYQDGTVAFTTKGDDRVHAFETATGRYEVLYDPEAVGPDAPLRGVDNLTFEEHSGDIYVAEDGGDMEIVLLTPEREMTRFLRLEGHDGSELTGPAFSPDGRRLYFSSQRGEAGLGVGVTYEVTGPFRGAAARRAAAAAASTTTSTTDTLRAVGTPTPGDGGTSGGLLIGGGIAAAGAAAAAALLALRQRGRQPAAATADVDGVGDDRDGSGT